MSLGTVASRFASASELPLLLTVEEAAEVLRIGRTLAYSLAHRYEESGGVTGLPVIRLGGCLRVPRWALLELACTGRVVSLSELAAHTAVLLGALDEEPPVDRDEQPQHFPDVDQCDAPKTNRPMRSASRTAAARRAGQQLVLLPSD